MVPALSFGKRAQISTRLPKGQTEEGEPRRKRGDKPSSQSAGFPWPQNGPQKQGPQDLPWVERVRKARQEWPGAAQRGERMRWDRPAPPLPSCVALGTFLNLFVLYLLSRNVTVLFSKGYCEIE